MPELIDKQAFMKALCDGCFKSRTVDIELKCRGTCNVTDILQQQPTIDPEVRHGRWNYRHEDDWCYCTACGTDAEVSDGECLETDYCPHCGARMDGGADNG